MKPNSYIPKELKSDIGKIEQPKKSCNKQTTTIDIKMATLLLLND